jgi:integrase/recombinase XerD
MPDTSLIGPWVRRFLMEHLVGERNLSRNTQASYRDTLVLLFPFVVSSVQRRVDQLLVNDVSPDVVRLFLLHLEQDRNCSVTTRNQRLAAIRALASFIGSSPEHIAWCAQIRAIPFKKTSRPVMAYLEKQEMDVVLDSPDRETSQGARDYALLLFLYNTGARADEAAHVTIADLNTGSYPSIRIVGKGNKVRYCPLWQLTISVMTPMGVGRPPIEFIFLNRKKQPLTRFGIHGIVKRHILKATCGLPSLGTKKISAHSIRHTTAVHLLRAGVDINTIRAWLGHVSIETTNIYAESDLEMKAKALAHCEIFSTARSKLNWHTNEGVMAFLRTL